MLNVSIQAGGHSSRMGQNKALMVFQGEPLIQRIAKRLAGIAAETHIISDDAAAYQFLCLPVFPDAIPSKGVLGGIYTAFLNSTQPFVAPVACDSPFINTLLLKAELAILTDSSADIVIPESQDGFEPLHAVYRKSTCQPLVEIAILNDNLRILSWFDQANVKVLSVSEIARIDPDPRIFLNLNCPEDFNQAEGFSSSN